MLDCSHSFNVTPRKAIRYLCNAIILIVSILNVFLLFSDLSYFSKHEFFASILPYEALIVLNTVVVPAIFCKLDALMFVWVVVYAALLLIGAILIACKQQIPSMIPIASNTAANIGCYIFNLTDLNEMQMEKLGFVINLGLYLMAFVAHVILLGTTEQPPQLPYYLPARYTLAVSNPILSGVQGSSSIQSLPTYSEAEILPNYDEAVKQEVQQK